MQTLSLISSGDRIFKSGPWDEEAFWFLGNSKLSSKIKFPDRRSLVHFNSQGLVITRCCDDSFAVMRSGNYLSRYGQQADQLHVDIWSGGANIAVDAGSYNYNRNQNIHNWFRGSQSHNTVIVAESDQMVPHRTFKYVNWAKGFSKEIAIDNVHSGILGVHQGYMRIPGRWCHARLIAYLDEMLVIIDRIWPFEFTESDTKLRLHWQFDLKIKDIQESLGTVTVNCESHKLIFLCSDKRVKFSNFTGSIDPFEGWVSRYYNSKVPVEAMNYVVESNHETWFLTAILRTGGDQSLSLCDKYVEIGGSRKWELDIFRDESNEMISEIL